MTREELLDDVMVISEEAELRMLILHNDEVHTFEYVIETLVKVCNHSSEQAEQCAWLTHHKGKCDVKKGSYTELKPYKDALIDRELQVTID